MAEEARQKSWSRFWFKLAIYAALFLAVIFTTLSMLGGKGKMLQVGAEQFFTRAFGHPARIETFNGLHFFPDFRLDIEGLIITERAAGAPDTDSAAGVRLAHIESLKMAMGFWDMAFRTGKVKAFAMEGLEFAPGYVHPARVTAERLAIMVAPDGGAPYLEGGGMIGDQPWTSRMGLVDDGEPGRPEYRFGAARDFIFTLADLRLEGVLVNEDGALAARDFRLSEKGREILHGHPVLQFPAGAGKAVLGGDMTLTADKAYALRPHMTIVRGGGVFEVNGRLGVIGDGDEGASVRAAFEALHRKIQTASGYALQEDGRLLLFNAPLALDVAIESEKGAP